MTELDMDLEVEPEDFTDALSDEALDREHGGIRLSYCNGGCAQS